MTEILKCIKCGNYTIKKICDKCSSKTTSPKPAKFSIEDKYGSYRRVYKEEYLEKND